MKSLLEKIKNQLNCFDQKIISIITAEKNEAQIVEKLVSDNVLTFTIKKRLKND